MSGAIIWIGGAFLFQVYGMVELRSRDTAAIARFAGNAGRIGEQLLIRRVFALLRVDLLFLFAIVFAMTVKPTSDDTWAILVVARSSSRAPRSSSAACARRALPEASPSATH